MIIRETILEYSIDLSPSCWWDFSLSAPLSHLLLPKVHYIEWLQLFGKTNCCQLD